MCTFVRCIQFEVRYDWCTDLRIWHLQITLYVKLLSGGTYGDAEKNLRIGYVKTGGGYFCPYEYNRS
jgi:hypothetical protein